MRPASAARWPSSLRAPGRTALDGGCSWRAANDAVAAIPKRGCKACKGAHSPPPRPHLATASFRRASCCLSPAESSRSPTAPPPRPHLATASFRRASCCLSPAESSRSSMASPLVSCRVYSWPFMAADRAATCAPSCTGSGAGAGRGRRAFLSERAAHASREGPQGPEG